MLEVALHALLQGTPIHRYWWAATVALVTIVYHTLVALFNPFDTHGDTYGSFNMLAGSFKSGMISLFRFPVFGKYQIDSLTFKVSLKFSWMWKVKVLLVVEHLSLDIRIADYFGTSIQSVGESNPKSGARKRSNNGILEVIRRFLAYIASVSIEIKSMNIAFNDDWRISVKETGAILGMPVSDESLKLDMFLQQLTVLCLTPTLHSVESTDSLDGTSSILSLPLLRIATLQSTVALPARDGSATMTVTTDDVSVCISPVHQEILTSTFVQIVNTISPHTDTYNNSKRFELLMATFGKIEEQSLRFQILIRDIPNIAHATAGDLSVLYESVAAVPDENELVFYDAEDTPMSTLKTGEPMHCKISVGHVTLWICANEATQPVQILRLAECAFEQQLPSTNANSATAQLMTTLSVQSLLSNAVVPLPQCLDGSFPAILQDTRPANAGASSFSSAAAASPWLSMRCAVVPDESQNAAASSSLASSACKKMDIDCAVSPFALPISLSALGTTLCSVTETFAAFSCLARHNKVGGLDRDCATNGLRVTAAAATSLGAINLSIPFADFRVTYPPALVEMCTTTAGTTSASADEQAVHVGHSSVGILIALRDLKVYNLYTAWQPIEQVFLSLTSLQAQCISADPIRGGSIPRRPFLDISSVNLSQIFSAAPPEESRPTAAAVTIAAPGLTSAVAYDQWAAVELSQLTDSGARFSSEVSLQVDKVSCSLALADMHALGVITGVLSTSSRLYQPLQHFHPSPIVLLDTHNCASYKVYAVVVSANVELVWTQAADTVVYSVLRNTQMSYSQQGLGGMYSRSRLYLHDEVIIHRVKYSLEETVNSVELLRITDPSVVRNKANGGAKAAVEEGPWEEGEVVRRSISEPASLKFTGISGRRLCLFSSKTTPNECFRAETSKSSCVALGVLGTFSNTALPSVLASLDIRYLDEMLQLVRTKTLGARTGTSFALRCASNPICPDSADSAWQNEYLMQVTSPTSITAVHLNSLKVTMQHELEPVLSLTAKSTDLHLMQFGPTLSQTAVVAHSLMLFELTAKYAVHTCIVGDISPSMPNRVELHVSCKDGEYSLMEAQLEQARVMYLQRSVMTLVSYLRDHFIAGLYTKLSVPEIPSDAPSPVPIPVWAPAPPPGRGIFRLAVKVQKSEAHIPMSSCSTDALVIVIDNGLLYRSYMGMTEEATAYCKGPLLRRKQWISEIKNSRRVIFLLFAEHAETVVLNTSINANLSGMNAQAVATPAGAGAGFAGGSALSQLFSPQQAVAPAPLENGTAGNISNSVAAAYTAVKWALPQVAAEALVPSAEISLNDDKELCLEFSVFNSVICSWCDANAVTDDITVHGSYVLAPLPPGPDGAYRSNMLIDISAAEVDWTLAQGQYLAIINLIQQNFCELQELVPEMYPLPPSKTVHLTEQIYGKYGLEADLPILSTVPIHIHKGKISAVESTPQYFSLFCVPLPPPHYPYGVDGHWIRPSTSVVNVEEVAFADTVPVYTKHTTHRDKLFAKMSAQAAARGERGANNQKKTSKSRQQTEVETGESIIGVLFEKLEVDFFRKHEGGGNGIEVSAGTFVIVGIEDRNPDDEDAASVRSVNLDELSLDSIIFAPRCLPLLNSGGNRTMFGSTKAAAGGDSNNLRFQSSNDDARAQIDPRAPLVNPSAVGGATASAEASVSVPHISYSQQGTGNLRRCIVTIADSMAVANIAKVLHTVEYFLQPVDVNTHRNLYCIAESHLGPYDYKIALDMEVHVSNTVVCLTNISRRDGANALCFQVNLDYVQAWRGFLSSGPGKIGLNIDVSVMNIYIAPMREINSSRIQSLVDPCVLVVGQDMMVCPPVEHLQHNLALLTPWMHLEKWAYRPNRTDTPNISRVVKFKVAPASSAANLGAARTAAAAPSASVSPQSRKKRRGKKAAVKRSRSEGDEASHVPHSASGDTAQDVPIDSESADKGTQREDGYESSSEDSASGDEDATVDVDDGDDDDEYSPRSGDAYYSGAESANVPTVHVRISMKDIFFISNAVKQARSALKKRLVVTANAQDYFAESKEMLQDIAHLPKLTYYLEHTSLLNPGKKNKNNELLAEICDFEAILRNNTYNLNILRFNVFDNCMLYTRSPEQLHMASGSACAMWTYNEATDMWEPLIEPINLRAIGATDESIQAAGLPGSATDGTKRKGAKVRVEVVTDPLEINAPQTALGHLIRKLSLADVVTTSSIHLPPYKVINELGVDVKFSIGMGDSVITENEILAGKSIPVEVQQLSEALDAFKLRRQFTVSAPVTSDSTSHKEYVMGISFPNFRDVYQSRAALPIDKVGVHTYEMFSTGQKVADPSGSGEVQFDKRRISMGGLGSAGMGVAAAIATAAAAAARARVPERRPATKDVVAFELAAERTSSEILIAADKTSSEILIAAESPIVPSATSPQTSPARPLPALPILPAAAEGSKEEGALLLRSTSLDFEKEKGENLEEDNGFDQLNSPRNPPMSVPATPSRVSSMSNTPNPGPCTPVAAAAVAATSPVPPSSPARPISLRRTNTTSSSVPPDPIKFVQEVPLAIMEMRIKADGVREILLRSFLSFKNNTTRVFQMSVRLYGSSVEMSLAPGQEWFVPVRFVNPKSSLFIRLDERANWFEALSSMQGLIVQGYWGDPSRLRAHLCACPSETPEASGGGNGWILLIKPEVKDAKAHLAGSNTKTFIPVRYPTKEAYMKTLKDGINSLDVNSSGSTGPSGSSGPTLKSRGANAQPLCIQLLAPLQLCNLLPQALLYRLADAEGLITSEGTLLPGEMVDVHSVFKLFASRIFISVRMLNYCWSKWNLVFSRTSPYSTTERSTDLTLTSMNFMHQSKELTLPTVDLSMVMKENLVRFSCTVLISNRTGMDLELCESSATENFVLHRSRTAAEAFLPVLGNLHAHQHRRKGRTDAQAGGEDSLVLHGRPSFQHKGRDSSDFGTGRSRRQYSREKQNAVLEVGDILEEEEDDSGSSTSCDSELENMSGSDFDEMNDEMEDSIAFENRISADSELENDSAGEEQERRDRTGDDNSGSPRRSLKVVIMKQGRFSQKSGKLTPHQRRRTQLTAPYSPFSPFSASAVFDSTVFTTPGTGAMAAAAATATASSNAPSAPKGGKIVILTVHFPFDHLRQVEVVASADWTLMDVFLRLKQRLAASTVHQTSSNYVFFPWENGKLGPRKVDNSLIIEAQQQYDAANNEGSATSVKIVRGGPDGSNGGNGGSSETASGAPTGSSAAPSSAPTMSMRERPISSMFSRERSVSTAQPAGN